MTETGKFIWNNASAHLAYTADLENGIFLIENVDEVGYEFLSRIQVGEEIRLTSNGNIELLVRNLEVKGQHVHCRAVVAS
jgi:hypothetical protein